MFGFKRIKKIQIHVINVVINATIKTPLKYISWDVHVLWLKVSFYHVTYKKMTLIYKNARANENFTQSHTTYKVLPQILDK